MVPDDVSNDELEGLYDQIDVDMARHWPSEDELQREIDELNDTVADMQGYVEDAELGDENDPEYRAEMFEIFRKLRWTPADIRDPDYAARYAEWLKTVPPDERIVRAPPMTAPPSLAREVEAGECHDEADKESSK